MVIYRRHKSTCKQKHDRISKLCRCKLWAKGTLEGKPYQKSLKTASWSRAEQIVRQIEDGKIEPKKEEGITIQAALDAFIADCEARNLNRSTLSKYRRLQSTLAGYLDEVGRSDIRGVDVSHVRGFRERRLLSPRTAAKELERLRCFFSFCVENEWITKNPAKKIKAPEVKPNPTLPFTDLEVVKLIGAADSRSGTFFKILLATGLRIIDAAQLRPEKIIDGRLFLHTEKTGVPVMLPLPPDLLADLSKLPLVGGFYFATESSNPISIAEYYRQKLMKAAMKAGLMEGRKRRKKGEPPKPRVKHPIHPHRFRDSFACGLLSKGVPIEVVSRILGHSDVSITYRHYAPWVKERQEQLDSAVRMTWQKPKLQLVKGGA